MTTPLAVAELRLQLISTVELWDCGDVDSFARVLDRLIAAVRAEDGTTPEAKPTNPSLNLED